MAWSRELELRKRAFSCVSLPLLLYGETEVIPEMTETWNLMMHKHLQQFEQVILPIDKFIKNKSSFGINSWDQFILKITWNNHASNLKKFKSTSHSVWESFFHIFYTFLQMLTMTWKSFRIYFWAIAMFRDATSPKVVVFIYRYTQVHINTLV